MNWIQWNLLRSKKSSLVSGTYEMTVISIGLFRWSFFDLCFTFLASLMVFLVPWKCRNCKFLGISSPYSSLLLTCFPFAKMPKAQWDRNKNMDAIIEISVAHVQLSSSVRISTNQRNSILVHFVDWFFHALQTLANQWLVNYHISMISSYILSLGSFFSQHRPFDTLWFHLHYTLTPSSKFLK